MNNTIEYDIRAGVIKPEYIGIITKPKSENYHFEDFRETPEIILEIDGYIRHSNPLNYAVFDCRETNTLSSVDYSKLDFDDWDTVYLFWEIQCYEDTNVTFSIESIAIQPLDKWEGSNS